MFDEKTFWKYPFLFIIYHVIPNAVLSYKVIVEDCFFELFFFFFSNSSEMLVKNQPTIKEKVKRLITVEITFYNVKLIQLFKSYKHLFISHPIFCLEIVHHVLFCDCSNILVLLNICYWFYLVEQDLVYWKKHLFQKKYALLWSEVILWLQPEETETFPNLAISSDIRSY